MQGGILDTSIGNINLSLHSFIHSFKNIYFLLQKHKLTNMVRVLTQICSQWIQWHMPKTQHSGAGAGGQIPRPTWAT